MTTTTIDQKDIADVYIADDDLRIAAEVALELMQPLLLTGEPGTGKTTFADYMARKLAPRRFGCGPLPIYKFETKSSSVSTDLFYRFDSLRRFHASHDDTMSRENRDYISFEALGKAILFSQPWSQVQDLLPDEKDHPGQGRSVVLIDEIDKAPRDFPNDILNEIGKMFFRIPEVQAKDERKVREVHAVEKYRPVVVLTSNSEKNLPEAFLRRCVFHHIRFPDSKKKARMLDIIKANLGQEDLDLVKAALDFFYEAREQAGLEKPPATAELVDWVKSLKARFRENQLAQRGSSSGSRINDLPRADLLGTLGTLAKKTDDLDRIRRLAETKLLRAESPQ